MRAGQSRVSIIMPVYNTMPYLEVSIKSVCNQTYSNFELIAIDDGSLDGSGRILDEYQRKDARIRVFHVKNGGPSKARNFGLDKAVGKWLFFVDSDDSLDPNALEVLVRNAEEFDYDMTIAGFYRDNSVSGLKSIHKPKHAELRGREEISKYLLKLKPAASGLILNYLWNRLIRLDVIKSNRIKFDESLRLGEDFSFLVLVIKNCRNILVLSEAFYHYCYHGTGSLIGRFDKDEFKRRSTMFDTLCSLYESFEILDLCKENLEIREGGYLVNAISKINYDTCTLNKEQKIEYIRDFLNPESVKRMLAYLRTQGGIKNRVKELMLKAGIAKLVYTVFDKS